MGRLISGTALAATWLAFVAGAYGQVPLDRAATQIRQGILDEYGRKEKLVREMAARDARVIAHYLLQESIEDRAIALTAIAAKEPGNASGALPTLGKILESDDTGEPFFVQARQRSRKTVKVASPLSLGALGKCGPEAKPLATKLFKEAVEANAIESIRAGCDAVGFLGIDDPEVISILKSPKPAWAGNARAALARIRAAE
jgi:hypothetical protein